MRKFLVGSSFLALSLPSVSQAASISYVGFLEDSTIPEWRTTSTVKPMDIDGNNIYGSHGAIVWGLAPGPNERPNGSTLPGWSYRGENGFQYYNAGDTRYAFVDDPANPGSDRRLGIGGAANGVGSFTFELTGSASTYAGMTVRVGVWADGVALEEAPIDYGKSYQIVQVVGGAAVGPVISLRGGAAGNHVPEAYFFDITGVNAGDQVRILAPSNPQLVGYMNYVTWDLAPVPESATLALGGLGGLMFLRRRR